LLHVVNHAAFKALLFGAAGKFNEVEAVAVSIDQDALTLLADWIKPQPDQQVQVRRLKLKAVRLTAKAMEIPQFDADITFGPDGELQRALLSDGKLKVELSPKDKGFRVAMEASGWKPPLGPALEFDEITMEAVFEPRQATISNIEGKIGFAPVKGSARASWGDGGIRVDGKFSVTKGDFTKLLGTFTRDFSSTGTLAANGSVVLQSATLENLFSEPRVDATFSLDQGVLNNVDLARALQSPSRDGVRGGTTRFNTITGSLQVSSTSYSYRQIQLSSGPLNASGSVDVSTRGDLSGRLNAELGSKTVTVARGTIIVSGNLKTPNLRQ